MSWVADKNNALRWHDEDEVIVSVSEITAALAEALKVVRVVRPQFSVGDKLTINATVTGVDKGVVNIVFDNVPAHFMRSFTYHAHTLAAASRYVAPESDAA